MARVKLTVDEAVAVLPNSPKIHVYAYNPSHSMTLIGADWDRDDVLKCFEQCDVELAGENAISIGHGIGFYDEYGNPHFVETDPEKLQTLINRYERIYNL